MDVLPVNYIKKSLIKSRKIPIFYIAVIVIFSSFLGLFGSSAAQDPVNASFVTDKMTDSRVSMSTDDGNVWLLKVDVVIQTDTAGKYNIFGDMLAGFINSQATKTKWLDAGENTVSLEFPTNEIYFSLKDGQYKILFTLKYQGSEVASLDYTTKNYYNHNDFKPEGEATTDYVVSLVSNTVQLQTDVFTAIIYEYQPVIEYYYSGDDGASAKFRITYTTLIGYADLNGDGVYNPVDDDPVYTADLTITNWNSIKVLFEGFESFDFEITGAVTLESNTNPDVNAEISFHYASASYTTNAQRKFDIDIQLTENQPLHGIDAIAIEHLIVDESLDETHSFEFDSASSIINFLNDEGLQHGFYSWIPEAETNSASGLVDVTASTVEKEDGTVLYLSYSYDESIVWYHHDPLIGINPDNLGTELAEAAEAILHNPALYVVSAFVAAVIVIGSLRRQKNKQ
jgi:hypothetical protein